MLDPPPSPPDRLAELLGSVPARALRDALELQHRKVELAVPEWTARGHTRAVLVAVTIRSASGAGSPVKCLVKLCPPTSLARESAKHYEALRTAPSSFAEAHLVRVDGFDPILSPDDNVLLGLSIAGGSLLRCRPMSSLPGADLAAACRAVVDGLVGEWTGDAYKLSEPTSVTGLLRQELRTTFGPVGWVRRWAQAAGLLDEHLTWISTSSDGVVPNPVLMANGGAAAGCQIRYVSGRSHGDLHDDNVLIPRGSDGVLQAGAFRLIDLATFEYEAPLSRDPAMLLVALLSKVVAGDMPESQQDALLRYVVYGDAAARHNLAPWLVAAVDALRDVSGMAFVAKGFHDEWELQYLVSAQAAALMHATYENLGERGRWWCFRLAAVVGREVLRRCQVPVGYPARGVDLSIVAAQKVARTPPA